MNFSETDIKILVVTGFTVLLVGATAGATPVAGGFGDMPTFNTSAELNVNIPQQPGADTTDSGQINAGANLTSDTIIVSNNIEVRINGVTYNETATPPTASFTLTKINQSTSNEVYETLELNQTKTVENANVDVNATFTEIDGNNAIIEWELIDYPANLDTPGGGGGGLLDVGADVAAWVGYIASLFAFVVDVVFSSITFTFTVIFDVVTYMFSISTWLIGGFTSMVTGAPVWAAPFIGLPVLLLGLELLKLMFIAINLLWVG